MPRANRYADLRALVDATRQLTPEELAELHLEQGYVDRALRIYEELSRAQPSNASYATRRAWLARMSAVRPIRPAPPRPLETAPQETAIALHGTVEAQRLRGRTRTLPGVSPTAAHAELAPAELAHAELAPAELAPPELAPAELAPPELAHAELAHAELAPAGVRQLRIVGVR